MKNNMRTAQDLLIELNASDESPRLALRPSVHAKLASRFWKL